MTRADFVRFAAVCAGGAAGTGARFLSNVWIPTLSGDRFPWPTLFVNALGSFLLGGIAMFSTKGLLSADARLVLGTGVMGGFTTYSTFNLETLKFLEDKNWGNGAAYLVATLAGCLAAGWAGIAAARTLSR